MKKQDRIDDIAILEHQKEHLVALLLYAAEYRERLAIDLEEPRLAEIARQLREEALQIDLS